MICLGIADPHPCTQAGLLPRPTLSHEAVSIASERLLQTSVHPSQKFFHPCRMPLCNNLFSCQLVSCRSWLCHAVSCSCHAPPVRAAGAGRGCSGSTETIFCTEPTCQVCVDCSPFFSSWRWNALWPSCQEHSVRRYPRFNHPVPVSYAHQAWLCCDLACPSASSRTAATKGGRELSRTSPSSLRSRPPFLTDPASPLQAPRVAPATSISPQMIFLDLWA